MQAGSLRRALDEAGIQLAPGEFLTDEEYQRLPQWFRDEMEVKMRRLIAERFGDDAIRG